MPWAFAQLRAALAPAMNRGIQRAPRTGVIVPPGRVPEPPEGPADEAERAGAAQADVGFPLHQPRDRLPVLRPRVPLAPSNQRHRLTPLDEQGLRIIGEDFPACVTSHADVIVLAPWPVTSARAAPVKSAARSTEFSEAPALPASREHGMFASRS